MNSSLTKRLIWNFSSLYLGVIGVTLIVFLIFWGLITLSEMTPKPVRSDIHLFPMEGLGEMMMAFSLAMLFIAIVLIAWTIRVIRDMIKFKLNKFFFLLNFIFLLVPYGPIFGYGIYKSYQWIYFYIQRERVTTNIDNYYSINLEKNEFIITYEYQKDSLLLFTSLRDSLYPQEKYRRLMLHSWLDQQIWLHELQVKYLNNTILEVANNYVPDTSSNDYAVQLKIKVAKADCVIPMYQEESKKLILKKQCGVKMSDSIIGFDMDNRIIPYLTYIDKHNNYWFVFHTKNEKTPLYSFYIGYSNFSENHVYKVTLKDIDRKTFNQYSILGLYHNRNNLYIIMPEKIIYFNLEKI